MRSLLLVEDEPGIVAPLTRLLAQEGYQVEHAGSAEVARRKLASGMRVDLVLLDWMLPGEQGVDLLRSWRSEGVVTPVVLLTARNDVIDKVLALELGADDYVTKPFEPRELLARIKARLRIAPTRRLSHAGIEMDEDAHLVTWRGAEVELTRMEYALLRLFLQNAGKVFSRDEILNRVWGFDAYPTTRTVDTHVLQLRNKTRAELFETVRGIGYRMAREGADS